ncbi:MULTISPECIES: hypothetical protein [Sphingobium]|jgi:hypothetical protein|uniref:hypothetical protein n=1 Tax=Sphingobium TaxID=165695 RepID=UPI001CA446DC|nr:hypothetical protein [Sphingobium sp. PNB]MCB4863205.1 hypothetical protein [Sphingobium sp. PNB]
MQITLAQFETIDGLLSSLHRMGDFETCADPRGYIQTSNRLLDACIDAVGYDAACEFPSAEECAAVIVARCLSSATLVMAA